jgi:DNA-binding NarL/FixJ family response regulator
MTVKAQVCLMENSPVLRHEIVAALSREPTIKVVEEVSDACVTVQTPRSSDEPIIAVVDTSYNCRDGINSIQRVKVRHPDMQVVAIADGESTPYLRKLVSAGARGCVSRDSIASDLGLAVTAVARGDSFLSPAIATAILADYRSHLGTNNRRSGHQPLTEREAQVLQLVTEGRSNSDIAEQLGISIKTVETHRTHLMRKLGVHERTALVKYALRTGAIAME